MLQQLESFWFPVMPSEELQPQPQMVPLLGRQLVLWRAADQRPAALNNRCRHRSAALSDGAVDADGHLHCPYHGWVFASDGHCLAIPQDPNLTIPEHCRVEAYQTQERYGLIWVCLAPEPRLPLPSLPQAEQDNVRRISGFHEVWNCSAFRVIENGLDNFHHYFVHRGVLDATSPIPDPIDGPITTTADGLRFSIPLRLSNSTRLEATIETGLDTLVVQRTVRWMAPLGLSLDLQWPNGRQQTIVLFATPQDAATCKILRFYLRNDKETEVRAADVISLERALIDQDRRILEGMPGGNDPWPADEWLIAADLPIARMRQQLQKFLAISS